MQNMGLEWFWRITQEPHLWRRYWSDGLAFLQLMATRVIPYTLWKIVNRNKYLCDRATVEVNVESGREHSIISISGNCFHDTIEPLRVVFAEQVSGSKNIILDLSAVPIVDGAFLGLCLMLYKHVCKGDGKLSFSGLNSNLRRIFRWHCVEFLL
jgi:N-acetylglucosaminyldiphosphoundecaprenol N-acetyl-beta-D-mannosaminyltransferase